jgi:hypothetical protein
VPALYSPGGFVKVFADARGGLFIVVRQLGASSVFPWRVCKGIRRCQGGLFIVARQLGASSVFPWRVCKGIRRCQGGLFIVAQQLGASYRAVRYQLVYL